jgi:extradiol dioxygenase family protein
MKKYLHSTWQYRCLIWNRQENFMWSFWIVSKVEILTIWVILDLYGHQYFVINLTTRPERRKK